MFGNANIYYAIMAVSILVFVELALDVPDIYFCQHRDGVSILVFVELALDD